jgi:phage terminase large subunit
LTAPVVESNPVAEYLDRYRDDPVQWVIDEFGHELRGGKPYPDQIEFLAAYGRRERRISKRSGHRVGKSTALAWMIVHHAVFRFPQKTTVTAPTERQLYNALAAEVKKWLAKLPYGLADLFEVTKDRIVLKSAPDESFVSFIVSRPEVPEAIAGVHSDWVLIVADEASGIPEAVFEAGAGSMAGAGAMTVLAGNPLRTSGLFFDTFHKLRHKWWTQHVSSEGHPNVTPDFIEDMVARYGRDSNPFRYRVQGEFPKTEVDTVIPFELAESALHRDIVATRVQPIWGVDIAREGSDKSALSKRQGNALMEPVKEWAGYDTMQSAGLLKREWDETPLSLRPSMIVVDAIGYGAGVADRLYEMGLPVYAINVAEVDSLRYPERYANLRAELAFEVREWLQKKDVRLCGVFPDGTEWRDDALVAEMVQPRYKYRSSGKILVESKEDMKKATRVGGRISPNKFDSFVLTFAVESVPLIHVGSKSDRQKALPSRDVVYE